MIETGKAALKRELGIIQTTMMGIGGAVCAGVFVTIGYAATLAGTALIIAMILCGIINFFTMLSYAELGATLPSAGGEYTFAKASFGGLVSFATGWFEWISNVFYSSFSALGFAYLISYVFPILSVPIVAVIAVALFAAINIKGVKETGFAQTSLVIILLALLVGFILYGIVTSQGTGTLDLKAPGGLMGILRASAFIFIVYLGAEAIAGAQAEVKDPGKTIPRALILTSIVLITIYTATAFVVFKVVPVENLVGQSSPLAYVADQLLGPLGVAIVTIAGVIAALSSVNTSTIAYSRVAYALARDGYFPKTFFSLHGRFCTPVIAIVTGSVLAALFAATGIVNFVAYSTDFGFIVGFIFVNLSLIKLRRSQPKMHRPFKVPLYPLTPILGIFTSLMLLLFLDPGTLLIGLELFVFGLVVYYLRMVGHERITTAIGGMNLGISAFSAIVAYMVLTESVLTALSQNIRMLLCTVTILISVTYLVAGLSDITKK